MSLNRPQVERMEAPADALDVSADSVLEDLLQLACHLLAVPAAAICTRSQHGTVVRACVGVEPARLLQDLDVAGPPPAGLAPRASDASGRAVSFAEVAFSPATALRFAVRVPLCRVDGSVLGEFVVLEHRGRALTADQSDALQTLADEAVAHLRRPFEPRLLERPVGAVGDETFSATDAALRALIEATPTAVIVLDPHGAVRIWSARAEALVEADGRPFAERLADVDAPEAVLIAGVLHAAHSNEPQELRLRLRLGRRVDVRIRASRAVHAHDQMEGYVGLVEDTTAQHATERRARAQHAMTRVLSEADGVETALSRIVAEFCSALGWSLGAAFLVDETTGGLALAVAYPSPDHAELNGLRRAAVRTLASDAVVFDSAIDPSSTHAGGPSGRSAASPCAWCLPILAAGRTVAVLTFGCAAAEVVDVLLREKLGLLARQLGHFFERTRIEEERDQFFNVSLDMLCLLSVEGRFLRLNPAWTHTLGYEVRALEGRPLVDFVHEDDRTATTAMLARLGQGEDARGFEHRFVARDGSLHSLSWACGGAQHGRVVLYAAARDVTQQRLEEDRQRETEEHRRHAQRLESTGRLAGWTAHYFNNLLTAIMGYSRLLIDRLPEGATTRDYARHILAAGERTASLTQQLLAFSRRQVMRPALVDLNVVVEDMERMLRPLLGSDVELRVTLSPSLERVLSDRAQLEQVLLNLVLNARDALVKGGIIVVSTRSLVLTEADALRRGSLSAGRYAMLRVEDTGVGMDEELRAKAFEPFFTTKRLGQGTGLGLSMVYGIVQQSGGHIALESAPHAGTAIEVLLPAAGVAEEPRLPFTPPHGSPRALRVLLVEDDTVVRDLTAEVLRQEGFLVTPAESAEAALRIAFTAGAAFEVLVTDLVLAGMTGRQLAHALAGPHPRMRVLYMSGYGGADLARLGVDEHQAFLPKPFTPEALAERVRLLVEHA